MLATKVAGASHLLQLVEVEVPAAVLSAECDGGRASGGEQQLGMSNELRKTSELFWELGCGVIWKECWFRYRRNGHVRRATLRAATHPHPS